LVNLIGLLTQSVFYFVCKSYHHESIDKSSLSDHLEVYLGDYVPLNKNSSIQLKICMSLYRIKPIHDFLSVEINDFVFLVTCMKQTILHL